MMMMDRMSAMNDTFTSFNPFSLNSPSEPDVDWSVFENADRYLLRDDNVWITRLSNDFWWNLERISELSKTDFHRMQQLDGNPSMNNRSQGPSKHFAQQQQQQQGFPPAMPLNAPATRKIVGQRSNAHRPAAIGNIPERSNFFQNLHSSVSDQDMEYNPFQSKISFDNHVWTNASQQAAIPWQ